VVEMLIKSQFPLNEATSCGCTPLMLAAKQHAPMNVGKLLLKYKAEVNVTDNIGLSALAYCIKFKNY